MNKKVSVIFNVVLSIAVVILFVLFFNLKKSVASATDVLPVVSTNSDTSKAPLSSTNIVAKNNSTESKIGYFELDSLESNYSYFKRINGDIISQEKSVQNKLQAMQNSFNEEVKAYQKKAPNMSQNDQMAYEQKLREMQNNYGVKQQRMMEQLNAEKGRKLVDIKLRVQRYLKKYAQAHGYSFIFAVDENDNIYYRDSSRNITGDLIKSLNKAN